MADGISPKNPLIDQLGIQQKQKDASKKTDSLGQGDFLKLMIAQMQNQDPMKPSDNGEFLGQMAQFSTVSGLQDMQKSLDTLTNSLVSNQALEASSMVGRFVRVTGDTNFLPPGEGDRFFGAVELEQSTSNLKFEILSEAGEVVKTIGVGAQSEGVVNFEWNGISDKGEMMPEGNYKVRATAFVNNENTSLETMVVAPVESVTLGRNGEQMKLNIAGVGSRSMDAVREIMS
jgi:flagellar basal-body rod modification protein FlgD